MADQVNQDSFRSHGHLTGLQLRDLIIDALNDNSLEWPMNFGQLTKVQWIYYMKNFGHFTKSQWIYYMKKDPNFYNKQTNDSSVFQAHERLLLDLASKLLKRKICLISLFPEDKDETFDRYA